MDCDNGIPYEILANDLSSFLVDTAGLSPQFAMLIFEIGSDPCSFLTLRGIKSFRNSCSKPLDVLDLLGSGNTLT